MTGKSDMSKPCIDYYKKLAGGLLILGGAALMIEHLFNFGGFDIELLGHEFYGFVMIATAYLVCMKWTQIKGVVKAIKNRNFHAIFDEGER